MNCACGKDIRASEGHLCVAKAEKQKIGPPIQKCHMFCSTSCAAEWLKLRLPWKDCVDCGKPLGRWRHFDRDSGPVCTRCYGKGNST